MGKQHHFYIVEMRYIQIMYMYSYRYPKSFLSRFCIAVYIYQLKILDQGGQKDSKL